MRPNRQKSSVSFDEGPEPMLEQPRPYVRPHRRATLRLSDSIPYPRTIIFIIANEFCERFTFYGVTTILGIYLKSQLKFEDSTATAIYHVFIMLCYFIPIGGAIIADSWLGKYRTILYMSIVYASGDTILSVSAIPGVPGVPFALLGLTLMATGAGCIKPCVSAFGGDQFVLPEQESYLKKYFSIFYFTINSGSFISSIITPILRQIDCLGEKSCYSLGFGVPTVLIILSIGFFLLGRKSYKRKKTDVNVIVKFCRCVGRALKKRERIKGHHWLDKAADKYDPAFIDEVKAALRILVLYIPLPFFWALFDQQGSRWTFQASRMNGDIGVLKISPDQMQVVNPILILVFIPLFEAFVYPAFAKYNMLKRPLQRMTVGGLLAALAFLLSAVVEYKLEDTYAVLPIPNEGQIRVYNALPQNITLKFITPPYDPVFIESLGFWKKYKIPAKEEATVKVQYTVKGTEKTENFTVYENTLTSYIITADQVVRIPNDDPDKSVDGFPKIMVIYAMPTKDVHVKIDGCKMTNEYIVTKEKPYTDYSEYMECDTYDVIVNDQTVIKNGIMKAGGVYVVIVLGGDGGALTAKPLTVIAPNSVHMLWLVPQYVLITAAEVMFSITGLEFSFTQAPISMKALMQAAWLLTVAVGNLIVAIVAQSKIFERVLFEFLLFAGLMTFDMFIFSIMAMRYKYVVFLDKKDAESTPKTV